MAPSLRPLSFRRQLRWVLEEWRSRRSVFGVPEALFFRPRPQDRFRSRLFGADLQAPLGPAAGPHTQTAPGILAAWLPGARFLELKTVQILDELEIPRPCIDAEDEGYNVEWSQELRLEESAAEYVRAWVWVHLLPHLLGFPDRTPGTVFNMSVGYNLEGIRHPRMQAFLARLEDASEEIEACREELRRQIPGLAALPIPSRVAGSCTLSTMHGCPPEEIERIAGYLLEEKGLHVFVKLNPTLLGAEEVRGILGGLGWDLTVPDRSFEHDLKYPLALGLLGRLSALAARVGRTFGVKLTNTLALENRKGVLPGEEMYLSGRPLFPLAVNLFARLRRDFPDLPVSFSAGADQDNLTDLFACGARTVTLATDLLRPGGVGRLGPALDRLGRALEARGVSDLEAFGAGGMEALDRLAAACRRDPRYGGRTVTPPRVSAPLEPFDCVAAPCVEACPVGQEVPLYARFLAAGDFDGAARAVLRRNPLPGVTGHVCPHRCQEVCTRSQLDEPLSIRALKRAAMEEGRPRPSAPPKPSGVRVAVVGAGPSGLAAASALALAGVAVTVFEAREEAGGMMALAPGFRLPREVLDRDVARIRDLGVEFRFRCPVEGPPERLLETFQGVYLACGFPRDGRLGLSGEDAPGVWGALSLLGALARGERPDLGERTLVVGGGNTALDAARAALRLGSETLLVYRRSRAQMPGAEEEIRAFLQEGGRIRELASPEGIFLREGRFAGLRCRVNRLGAPGRDRRPRPEPTEACFDLEAQALVAAVGQVPERLLFRDSRIALEEDGRGRVRSTGVSSVPGVYLGGDLVRGPETVVGACADGIRAAEALCAALGVPLEPEPLSSAPTEEELTELRLRRVRREPRREEPSRIGPAPRDFAPSTDALDREAARAEAARCLGCDHLCDKCVDVCPNRANLAYSLTPLCLEVPVLACDSEGVEPVGREEVRIRTSRQILHLEDLCNRCGNCATFCVHPGRPYEDKPRLFLHRGDFEAEERNALWLDREGIQWKNRGLCSLEKLEDRWVYRDPRLEAELTEGFEVRALRLRAPFPGTWSLAEAARMGALFLGVRTSAPFLPGGDEETEGTR